LGAKLYVFSGSTPIFKGVLLKMMCFLCGYPPKIFGDVTGKTLLGDFISALLYIKAISGL